MTLLAKTVPAGALHTTAAEQQQAASNTARANQAAAQQKAAAAAPTYLGINTPTFADAAGTTQADLASGNYLGAWQTALGTAGDFGTPSVNTTTTDPLIQDMMTNEGLAALDPHPYGSTTNGNAIMWSPQQEQAYYDAFGQATGALNSQNQDTGKFNANPLGKNASGDWGTAATDITKMNAAAATNANTAFGGASGAAFNAPNIEQYLGAQPVGGNFYTNNKQDINSVLAVIAAGVAPELLAAVGPAAAGAAADAGFSTAAGSALIGSGSAAGLAGGIGAGALTGAGMGALNGALNGGNIGKDALIGGLTGGITGGLNAPGSVTQTLEGDLSPTIGTVGADALVKGVEGAGVGALSGTLGGNGALNGAATGGVGGVISGTLGGLGAGSAANTVGGTIGNIVGNKLAAPKGPSATSPVPVPTSSTTSSNGALPTLPGTSGPGTAYQPQPAPGGALNTAGLGYAPRQEANMSGTDWATYGQGPEQQFFVPLGSQQPSGQQPAQSNIQTPTPGHST